jgi:hypothetical protein
MRARVTPQETARRGEEGGGQGGSTGSASGPSLGLQGCCNLDDRSSDDQILFSRANWFETRNHSRIVNVR